MGKWAKVLLELSKNGAGLHVGGGKIRHEFFGLYSVRNVMHDFR